MKKLFYLMLLCAAVIFTSCDSKDPVDDIVGTYTYTETGYFTIAGQSQKMDYSGSFTVSRVTGNRIRFSGDFIGSGTLSSNNVLLIDADTDDFTSDGIRYHYDNTYVDGHYYSFGSMSWKQNSEVTAYYNGQVLKGSINLFVSAKKK